MKTTNKFVSVFLVIFIMVSLVSCHKDTTRLGKIIDASDIVTIEVSYSRFDAVIYALDGSSKDRFFMLVLSNKHVTDDETRISDLKETIGTGEELILITFGKSTGKDIIVFISKATGEFLVAEVTVDESTLSKTYEYICASVEGEHISIDSLKRFCH